MEGGSLGSLVRKSVLEEDVAKIYVKQILNGLVFLHKK
jgi:serine/threonine protein kinase